MPSRRVPVAAQIRLLIAASRLGGEHLRPFSIHDAAAQAGIAAGSARYATRFLVEAGLWRAGTDPATYVPTEAGREFGLRWESSRERARMVVNGLFKVMWFHATLCRQLADGPVHVEAMEQALLADGGGHPQHVRLATCLLEWQAIAYLIEQTPDGMVVPGPHLGADLRSVTSATDSRLPPPGAAPPESEPDPDAVAATGPPSPSLPTVMAALVLESLYALEPDELPLFVRVLGLLSRNEDSVLHRR